MGLVGRPLLVLAVTLAALAPLVVVAWWRRGRAGSALGLLGRLLAVLLCQVLAVSALFLAVNDQYSFYTSWSDVLGRRSAPTGIETGGLLQPGQGRVEVLTVHGSPGTGGSHQVLAWLPPQYDEPGQAATRFPVLMVLPGQPSTPEAMFSHYDFAATASAEISSGRVPPFVAVFPPLMTDPPRDTECTDVPGGPQADTWLRTDVPAAVDHDLRTTHEPWGLFGWSTGAFCSAKLVLQDPHRFAAAAGLGGYYAPLTDHTTGDLFHGSAHRRALNSPAWLYRRTGLQGRRLLLVSGRKDPESYPQTASFLRLAAGDRAVSSVIFPTGGHNYRNYATYLGPALRWWAGTTGG